MKDTNRASAHLARRDFPGGRDELEQCLDRVSLAGGTVATQLHPFRRDRQRVAFASFFLGRGFAAQLDARPQIDRTRVAFDRRRYAAALTQSVAQRACGDEFAIEGVG